MIMRNNNINNLCERDKNVGMTITWITNITNCFGEIEEAKEEVQT